ncbi:N-ethylmaleimide reductase [Luteibacter sp. UNCMF331Sha3.1]|uniref:alkene reductase n=1 Tax=Luteibacter sp. UNCMF331Sha3.1 TaxID=1502760 RepID=UPI0008B21D38|nr:alkene reductase [Luteibacter sp. UNCMF331Sha3.1]SEN10475.1 N-ethylmaleimide reductase [Luteibacter sp. UNCMF331Sha3.1]
MAQHDVLFTPVRLGALALPNRLVMPAMMRMRAIGGVPHPATAEYYAQRAAAGLIIAEATAVSIDGAGYPGMAGIYTARQVAAWRAVTDAVHDEGGRIVLQLVHHGRLVSKTDLPPAFHPVAPSAIAASGRAVTRAFERVPFDVPRALDDTELDAVVSTFWKAARSALDAGFDGVEINAANGSLLDQFLHDGANRRGGAYGGPIDNRVRLLLNVVDAISDAIGPDLTGVRLSPFGRMGALTDSDPVALYAKTFASLDARSLAWLHLIEPGSPTSDIDEWTETVRVAYTGAIISAGGHTAESAARAINDGVAAAVAFGRPFVANPDLPLRLRLGLPLNVADEETFFGGGERGYTDYPAIARRLAGVGIKPREAPGQSRSISGLCAP